MGDAGYWHLVLLYSMLELCCPFGMCMTISSGGSRMWGTGGGAPINPVKHVVKHVVGG